MSTAWVECWKCDDCGHRWIKTEMWPAQCASSKCRKRSWNRNAAAGKDESSKPNVLPSGTYGASMGTVVKSPAEAKEPQAAPIPAVKMNDAMAVFVSKLSAVRSEPVCVAEIEDDTPSCRECDRRMFGKLIKGRGMVYACTDVSCPLYGMEKHQ